MHLGGHIYSHVEMLNLKAAEKQSWRLLLAVWLRLTVLTAGHECKHNACRAEIGGCVSGYTCISRIRNKCVQCPRDIFLKAGQAGSRGYSAAM